MTRDSKAKRKVKAKPRKQTKAGKVEVRPDGLRKDSAGAKLVDAVCSKAGATHAELRGVVKWRSCLPFMLKSAKQAGVRLRKQRQEDGQVRYFGTARA